MGRMPESLEERAEIASVSNVGQAFVGFLLLGLNFFLRFDATLCDFLLFLTFFRLEFTKLFSLRINRQPCLALFDHFNILLIIDVETLILLFKNLRDLHVFLRVTLMQRHVHLEQASETLSKLGELVGLGFELWRTLFQHFCGRYRCFKQVGKLFHVLKEIGRVNLVPKQEEGQQLHAHL